MAMEDDVSSKPTVQSQGRRGAPAPADIAALFPQLEIIEILGQGGMGVVYKARQKSLDRLVAVKVLTPRPDDNGAFTARFNREAHALARLQHPNIVTIHDSGEAGEYYYFVMEYVDGTDLRQLMSSGAMPPEQALTIVPSICDALEYAHEEGIAHRDIKPENILIDRKGRVKIADFGIAKLLEPSQTDYTLTSPLQMIGTMHYMAPEQIERPSEVDHRADIYALGVVFYEMLTGELPLGRFPLPSECMPIDTRLDDVVLQALEKEPARRYQRISEIRTRVEAIRQTPSGINVGSAVTNQDRAPTLADVPRDIINEIAAGHRHIGIAYICWLAIFVGACGVHRMYAGKWITGIIWFLTGGLFLVGQFIDLLLIPGMIERKNLEKALLKSAGYLQPGVPLATPPPPPPPPATIDPANRR